MTRIARGNQPIGGGARDDQELVQPSGGGASSSWTNNAGASFDRGVNMMMTLAKMAIVYTA